MTDLELIPVNTKSQLAQFIRFPRELYRKNPHYIPDLNLSVRSRLSKKNPFLQHSEIAMFLVENKGLTVGRIAAILNRSHLDYYKDDTGFFGFFDAVDDFDVARALFNASSHWLKEKGVSTLCGPTNLTTNESCGILINGFEYPNMVSMPYNYQYYDGLCQQCGFEKAMDMYSYEISENPTFDRYSNIMNRTLQKLKNEGIIIRALSKSNFKSDIEKLRKVYNRSNENNWGFIPLDEGEFLAMANELKIIMPFDLALLVEKNNEIIGFVVAVPDINQALKKLNNGRLFPLGIFKLLWFKRKINKARIMILGVLKPFRRLGLDLLLYHNITLALNNHNIYSGEASFVLETNTVMNDIMKKLGGNRIKEYRMYRKSIN